MMQVTISAGIPMQGVSSRELGEINHLYAYVVNNPLMYSDPYGLGLFSGLAKLFKLGDEAVVQGMVADSVFGGAAAACDIKDSCEFTSTNNQVVDSLVGASEVGGGYSTLTLMGAAASNPIGATIAGAGLCIAGAGAGGLMIGNGINTILEANGISLGSSAYGLINE